MFVHVHTLGVHTRRSYATCVCIRRVEFVGRVAGLFDGVHVRSG